MRKQQIKSTTTTESKITNTNGLVTEANFQKFQKLKIKYFALLIF